MTHLLGSPDLPLRVAVVGSGPSGFYAIAALFKSGLAVTVDLFDRLPTPFGLVRGGVAPDHQKIKSVIRVYNKTAENPAFRFFGNVAVGRDLSIDDLRRHYHQVVLAVGNESDRRLGIPGEDLAGVHSATEFVGWYNGHPDFQDRAFDLGRARRVAVVGNGNVAMDVTRILAEEPTALEPTDITDEALAELRRSRVEEIVLLGRRGPAEAAFSPPEIKEIGALEHADLIVAPGEVELDDASLIWLEQAAPAARKNVDYLTEASKRAPKGAPRRVVVRFLVSPVELLGDGEGRLRAVRLERNELVPDASGTPRPRGTGRFEELQVELLFKAVGYHGQPLAGVPFDERRGILPNVEGRVVDPASGAPVPGLYAVGWAKRGPSGLIGTNGPDSEATVAKMVEDARATSAAGDQESKRPEAIVDLLCTRGIDAVTFGDWQRLDRDELARGESRGKCRLKYTSVETMMEAVRRLRSS